MNGSDPSGLSYLNQEVSSAFYVDDEGTRWLVENGEPDATNPGWSKSSIYSGGNWLSDRDAAFMSVIANYVTEPNKTGQKGMGGNGSGSDGNGYQHLKLLHHLEGQSVQILLV